jgi:protein TonB
MVIDGKPQGITFTVTMRFTLDGKKTPKVESAVEGGVAGGVKGGVVGGVVGGALGAKDIRQFEGDAVRAEGEIKPPKLVKEVVPVYPEAARSAGVHGVVILGVKTDEAGKVVDLIVLRSIPLLDQAAIDAVRQWVYEPVVVNGKTVTAVFTQTIRFQLK